MRFITKYSVTVRGCAAFALALGLLTLTGWALGIAELVQIRPEWTPMVVNSGVGFVLAGLGLLAASWSGRGVATLAMVFGLLCVLLAVEELAVLAFDIAPALSLPELHRPLQLGYPHPGRMAPNTALCFLLYGGGLFAISRWQQASVGGWVRKAAVTVMAIGLLGVIGYSLQLEYLYGWTGVVRMAVHTGVGMVVLGFGLWTLAASRAATPVVFDGREVEAVYSTATALLLLVAGSAGIAGFAFLQSRVEGQLRELLQQMSADRIVLLEQIIEHRSMRAKLASGDREPAALFRALLAAPRDERALEALRAWARELRGNGFSSFSAQADGQRWQLDGTPARPALSVTLRGRNSGWLLWQNGYLLRRSLPLADVDGVVGMLVTEQPLTILDTIRSATIGLGDSGEMALCSGDARMLHCFPTRNRTKPFAASRVDGGQPLPMDYALRGMSGTLVAFDYRKQRVLAAYGPVGDTGLGLVVKKDIAEIYAPIRQQFQRIVVFLIALLVFGLWLLRRRLRPLLHALEESRARARAEAARFAAAVESSLDAFFILECMRDAAGHAYDLRYVLLNEGAERTLRLPRAQVIGRGMCELFPERRTDGMLATYLRAVETGQAISEERSAPSHTGQTRWYHLQAVKLGDGLGVTVRDITSARHAANLIHHQATHDPLTGLANRTALEMAIATAIADSRSRGQVTAVALLDLDDFKQINDSLGHAAGDQLLKEVAQRLRDCMRPTDTVARLGGDEFVLVLPNINYPDGAAIVAQKLLYSIARPIRIEERTIQVTVSVGISAYPQDGVDTASLLKRADTAMYRAKHAGHNGFALFDAASDTISSGS